MDRNNQKHLEDFFQDVINRGDIDATDRYIGSSITRRGPATRPPALASRQGSRKCAPASPTCPSPSSA